MNQLLRPFLTFGIGSVPFREGEDSCELIFKRWDIPFWPQYPKRSLREHFIFQFLKGFPGLHVSDHEASFEEKEYLLARQDYNESLREAFQNRTFLPFEPEGEWALGYTEMKSLLARDLFPDKGLIKLQITAPDLIDEFFFSQRVSPEARRQVQGDLWEASTAAGLAQIERIYSLGRAPLIFIDQPTPPKDFSKLSEMVHRFKEAEALVGLHLCSHATWKGLEKLDLDLLHFDLQSQPLFSLENRALLQKLIQQRKWLAWGLVSTRPPFPVRGEDSSPLLLSRIKELADERLPLEEIANHSLLAPACGTGSLSEAEDEAVYESVRLSSLKLKGLFLTTA